MVECTKEATWGKFGTPICCCEECNENRLVTARRVFVSQGIGNKSELNWDLEFCGSYQNYEWGK